MRFFSNDSRDSADEESEPAQAPAAVPLQRPSSPWAASPGSPDPAADQEAGERPPFHEPGPQPTAFGAGTVGGAVAASATANPLNDDVSDLPDTTDRRTDAAHGVADDRMVQPGDGAVRDSTGDAPGTRPGGAPGDAPIAVPFTGTGDAPVTGSGHRHDERQVEHRTDDLPLKDGGTFDDPVVADDRNPARTDDGDLPLKDGGTFDDPVVVEQGGEARTFAGSSSTETADESPAVGGAAVPASDNGVRGDQLPGAVAAPEVGPLFADADAHSFRDRWRDVQLRFVDDPKAATDDAAKLVDDAVDALATSLRKQREQLTGGTGSDTGSDTEQLRVRLRGYRDFLDRMLDL